MLDPFTLVYNKLWDMANASVPLNALVKVGNRIRFDDPKNRDPIKDTVAVADLPEICLTTIGSGEVNSHQSSCTSMVTRQFQWLVNTGDFRLTEFMYPVEFALFAAMINWRGVLSQLTWGPNDYPFVKKCDWVGLTEGNSNPLLNRGIRGWSSLWGINVMIVLPTQDLIVYNSTGAK